LDVFIKWRGGGDFREGLTKQDFLAHFKLSFFERPGDEPRTFRTKPKIEEEKKPENKKMFGT
jgi:hypothetical protein